MKNEMNENARNKNAFETFIALYFKHSMLNGTRYQTSLFFERTYLLVELPDGAMSKMAHFLYTRDFYSHMLTRYFSSRFIAINDTRLLVFLASSTICKSFV